MDKSIGIMIVVFLLFIYVNCNSYKENEMHRFYIEDANKEQLLSIKLKKKYHFQKMLIVENSLNDTCMLGLMKVSPGKTGLLYRIEFFSDTISYSYIPYKASNGKLKIEHSFSDE